MPSTLQRFVDHDGRRAGRCRGRQWPGLVATTREELCRESAPRLGDWLPAARWWRGNEPEWDVVAESHDRAALLVGEARKSWSRE